ncbi:MAG: glycosyltransferase [Nibricoccus sp.]
MARILIVSSGSPCRNPRAFKEASALGAAGYDVTLLTVSESPALDAMEKHLVVGSPFRHQSVGGRRNALNVFLGRLQRRLATTATKMGFETLHALGSARLLRREVFAQDADLTIVHNEIPFWIGCELLRRGRLVAADFEDWYSEDLLPSARRYRPIRKIQNLERTLLQRAVYCSTTSGALSAALAARYQAPAPLVVTNSFPLQSYPSNAVPGSPPVMFWFSQTIGPGRGLEEFFRAWTRTAHPGRTVLLGNVQLGYDRHVFGLLPETHRKLVCFRPFVEPSKLPTIIAAHDIGLALEPDTPANKNLTISNKILQYLNAGLAVVASHTAGQREVLAHAPEAGVLVDLAATADFAAKLDALLVERTRLVQAKAAARKLAESQYCWERESPRLLARVRQAIDA